MSSHLTITTLGDLIIQQNGEKVTNFPSRKAEALLIYLAVENSGSIRRESLFTLLWPGMPEKSARHNLRQVLYSLRQIFGEVAAIDGIETVPLLLSDRNTVQINPQAAAEVDVHQLDRSLEETQVHDHLNLAGCEDCIQTLEGIVNLYGGDFLNDFYLEDSNQFEDWVQVNREAYRAKALETLASLTEIFIQKGNYDQARVYADQQLKIDPLREIAYRQLMELLSKSGQRAEALRVYQQCARKLEIELGTHPSRETTALFEIIRGEDVQKSATPLREGAIRGYEIREHLGSGHTGAVYKAYQPVVGRDVAIKVILPQFANHPDFIRRFEVEAQLVARLEHPHIVPLYDYWRDPSGAYLVMRWLKGGNLQADLARGGWKPAAAVNLVDQIGAALSLAHRQGVVHCDIKPANILLDEESNAYLTDFGIAILTGPLAQLSQTLSSGNGGSSSGSLGYVSPETARGLETTSLADIYSLGVVLYELLTGAHPFPGIEGETLVQKHLTEPLPSVLNLRPELPQAVDDVIKQATQKDPAGRYPDVDTLARDFRLALAPESVPPAEIPEVKVITRNPYKGLRPFAEADAADFFGRDELVERLVSRLSPGDNLTEPARFLAVVGPSGSGKSSVAKAGLIPAIRRGAVPGSENWFVAEMTPGSHPLEELETALLRIAMETPEDLLKQLTSDPRGFIKVLRRALPGKDNLVLLVIDQFEETFTLVENDAERNHFLELLAAAVNEPYSPLRLVITLRADFYDRPLEHSEFGQLLQEATEVVLPLTPEELDRAISGPAEGVGASLEPALVARILQEVGDQPGALPLLQYALTETFEEREDHQLTLAAYEASGGVLGALGRRAEEIYRSLGETEQALTRQIFLRLVTLGEGIEDTRRRVPLSELEGMLSDGGRKTEDRHPPGLSLVEGPSVVGPVVDRFGKHRLLTFDHDPATRAPTVEIAHEALLREWPRLRGWLDESRDDIRIQRLLGIATREWEESGHDPGFLLRGARLDQFALWVEDTNVALTADESAYLDASLEKRQERETAEAERQAHEAQLEQRSRRFLRALVGVFAVAAVIAILLSGVAFNQSGIAQENALIANQNAATATFAQGEALDLADSRATQQAIAEDEAFARATQQAIAEEESYARATQQAIAEEEAQQRAAAEAVAQENLHLARANELGAAAVGIAEQQPDLALLLSVEAYRQSSTLQNWTALYSVGTQNPQLFRTLRGHTGRVESIVFGADGKRLFSGGEDGTVRIWDLDPLSAAYGSYLILPHDMDAPIIEGIALSPDGKLLAAGTKDSHVLIWDVDPESQTNTQLLINYAEENPLGGRNWVAFSPTDPILAAVPKSGQVDLIDVDPVSPTFGERLGGIFNDGIFDSVAFSHDGETLVTADLLTYQIFLWHVDLSDPNFGHQIDTLLDTCVESLAFSPDGKLLGAALCEEEIRLWNVESGSPDYGELLVSLTGHGWWVLNIAFSPDSHQLASVAGWDETALVWDVDPDSQTFGEQIGSPLQHGHFVDSVAFSPDGDILAVGTGDGTIRFWDLTLGTLPQVEREYLEGQSQQSIPHPLETVLLGHTGLIEGVAFSPNGKFLASGGGGTDGSGEGDLDGTIRLWDVDPSSPTFGQQVGEPLRGHEDWITGLAYGPDSTRLASSSGDLTVRLWDVDPHSPTFGQTIGDPMEGHEAVVKQVAFSPNGRIVASGDDEGVVYMWDADPNSPTFGQALAGPLTDPGTTYIEGLAFSPDGAFLANGPGGEWNWGMSRYDAIRLWDANPESPGFGELVVELWGGHTGGIDRVAFHPEGKILGSASQDFTIRLWDVDPESPNFGQVIGPPLVAGNMVYGLAFSPDGKHLVTGMHVEGELQLWDVDPTSPTFGQPLGVPLNQENLNLISVAYSPDGKFLAIGDVDYRVHLWNVDTAAWITHNCERAGRNLTEVEWDQYLSWVGPYDPSYKTCPQWP